MQWVFLILAVAGAVLPLTYGMGFLFDHGLNLRLFISQFFQTNVSAFFAMDVLVSAFVLILFIFGEGRRRHMKNLWVYAVSTLLVGVSLGLPLFLFARQRKLISEAPHR